MIFWKFYFCTNSRSSLLRKKKGWKKIIAKYDLFDSGEKWEYALFFGNQSEFELLQEASRKRNEK